MEKKKIVDRDPKRAKEIIAEEFHKYQVADTNTKNGPFKTVAYYADEEFRLFAFRPYVMVGTKGNVYNLKTGYKLRPTTSHDPQGNPKYNNVRVPQYGPIGLHRLMMMTYFPIPNVDDMQVNHIDGHKRHNELSNLEWVTPQENMDHAVIHNLVARGEQTGSSVRTENEVRQICEYMVQGCKPLEIANLMNIPYSDAFCNFTSRLRTGEVWTHITKDYTFPSTVQHNEEEIIYICELLAKGIRPEEVSKMASEYFGYPIRKFLVDAVLYKDKYVNKYRYIIDKYTFPNLRAPLVTEEEVHTICKYIEMGYDTYKILELMKKPVNASYVQLLRGISSGVKWKNIAQYYDVIGKLPPINPRLDKNLIEEICKRLEKGMDKSQILEDLQLENTQANHMLIYRLKNHKVHEDIVSKYNF